MHIFRSQLTLNQYLTDLRNNKNSIGFVPTMGALHSGHLQLIKECKQACSVCVVSIFVNPRQFNDPLDFARYPRDENHDLGLLEAAGCELVYIPDVQDIYSENSTDYPFSHPLMNQLEGKSRPGHFEGVVQVVMRFFDIIRPDKAFFGLKDLQQFVILKLATTHFKKPVVMVGVNTLRADSGLALSSRNQLLSDEMRDKAAFIFSSLQQVKLKKSNPIALKMQVFDDLKTNGFEPEYVEICEPEHLQEVSAWPEFQQYVILCAVRLAGIRLIDNLIFE